MLKPLYCFILSSSFLTAAIEARPLFDPDGEIETAIPPSISNRLSFSRPDLFLFESLKERDSLSIQQKKDKEDLFGQQMRDAFEIRRNGQFTEATDILTQNASLGSHRSMTMLGLWNESEGKDTEAFYWHFLAHLTGLLQGIPVDDMWEIIKVKTEKKGTPEQKEYVTSLSMSLSSLSRELGFQNKVQERAVILAPSIVQRVSEFLDEEIVETCYKGMGNLASSPKVWENLGELFGEQVVRQKKAQAEKRADECYRNANTPYANFRLGCLTDEGYILSDLPKEQRYEEAAAFYRKAKKLPDALVNLGLLIEKGLVTTDEKGASIQGNRYEVAARLYRTAKTPGALHNLANLIANGSTKLDLKGKKIEDENRYEVATAVYAREGSPKSIYAIANLIRMGLTKKDNFGKIIVKDKRNLLAFNLYRQAAADLPEAFSELALLIRDENINQDEFGMVIKPGQKIEVIASLFRKAATAAAYHDLAYMIEHGQIHHDEDNQPFPENKRYEKAACLYRKTALPDSLYNIAILIREGHIRHDENNQEFSEDERFEIVGRLLQKIAISESWGAMASLILAGLYNKDENNQEFSEDERFMIAARLYRKALFPSDLHNLALLIGEGYVNADENGQPFVEEKRAEIVNNLFLRANCAGSLTNLALFKLRGTESDDLKAKKEALSLLFQAIVKGDGAAEGYYAILKSNIEEIEKLTKENAQQVFQEIQRDEDSTSSSSENEEDDDTDSLQKGAQGTEIEETTPENLALASSQENLFSQVIIDHSAAVNQVNDVSSTQAPLEDIKVAEMSAKFETEIALEGRRRLKALKKKQRYDMKTDKLPNKRFKSLLNQKISRDEFSSLLRRDEHIKNKECCIKWTSRAREQFSKIIAVNVKRILFLIEAIKSGDTKRGKPETLVRGIESRRINQKDRLVYRIEGKEIEILSCEGHYDLVVDTECSTSRSASSSSS